MAFHPVAPTAPLAPPRLFTRVIDQASTSSVPLALGTTNPVGQIFGALPFEEASGVYMDQFDAHLDRPTHAVDALAYASSTDRRGPTSGGSMPSSAAPFIRWRHAHDQSWNREALGQVFQTSQTRLSTSFRQDERHRASEKSAQNTQPDGNMSRHADFLGHAGHGDLVGTNDDLVAENPSLPQNRHVGSVINTMTFGLCGYASMAGAPIRSQRRLSGCVNVDASRASHQDQNHQVGCFPIASDAAPDSIASTWGAEQGNLRQEEPRKFDVNSQCMPRALGTKVRRASPGCNSFTFDVSAAEWQRSPVAHTSQNSLVASGLGTKPNNCHNYAHIASSISADRCSTFPLTRPPGIWEPFHEMPGSVLDQTPSGGYDSTTDNVILALSSGPRAHTGGVTNGLEATTDCNVHAQDGSCVQNRASQNHDVPHTKLSRDSFAKNTTERVDNQDIGYPDLPGTRRQKRRLGLLAALHIDKGVQISLDPSGQPSFLREHRQTQKASGADVSPPPEAAVPIPRLL